MYFEGQVPQLLLLEVLDSVVGPAVKGSSVVESVVRAFMKENTYQI